MTSLIYSMPAILLAGLLVCMPVALAKRSTQGTPATRKTMDAKLSLANHIPNQPDFIEISEEMPEKSLLGIMEILGPVQGSVTCAVDSPYISAEMLGSPKVFKIDLKKYLDRERVSKFKAKVECKDQETPHPTTVSRSFTVEVLDENDNAPNFTQSIYVANVTENAPVGDVIMTVKAMDADEGDNAMFTYALAPLDNPFAIDEVSGVITTTKWLDRETTPNFTFKVTAIDKGKPANTGSAVVIVYVDDENDHAPEIVGKRFHVRENQPANTLVGKLTAADRDVGKNAEPVFSKVENDEFSLTAPFEVKPNGNIISIIPLDRELRSEYTMTVMVKDKGIPRLSSSSTVVIVVDDTNDNAPEFVSPCLTEDYLTSWNAGFLPDNETLGSSGIIVIDWFTPKEEMIVYQAKVVDRDLGDNSRLVYGLQEPSADSLDNFTEPLFSIDRFTGSLTLNRPLLMQDGLTSLINVTVTDSGHPARMAFCLLNVTFDVDISQLQQPGPAQDIGLSPVNTAVTILPKMSPILALVMSVLHRLHLFL